MSDLNSYFYLNRAGRYSSPRNSNSRLPIVYGDLTDGVMGNWELPCIHTGDWNVFCYADHPVQTVADGNSINIYAEGTLLNTDAYSFNASDDYEGLGNIATITIWVDQGTGDVTARGKGKTTGATLIDNIVDIVNDFLTVKNTFTSALYDATAKAKALATFTVQSYNAAGVICEDAAIWDILQEMMSSFYGSAFLNGKKELVLSIDDGTISQYPNAAIIRKSDIKLIQATQTMDNLINQCPASYCYNYFAKEFYSHTDDTAHASTISQNIFGVQTPNSPYRHYWCRNLASVQKIQDIIVAKYKYPIWEIEFDDYSLKAIHVDVEDIITATFDDLYSKYDSQLINQYCKVISVRPDLSRGRITFRVHDTGLFETFAYLADGTYLANGSITAGGGRDTTDY